MNCIFLVGTTSTGDTGVFYPLYLSSCRCKCEDTRLGGAGVKCVLNFTEITRGPNNETVSNESSTNFYLHRYDRLVLLTKEYLRLQLYQVTSNHHITIQVLQTNILSMVQATADVTLNLVEGKTYRFGNQTLKLKSPFKIFYN